MRHIREARGVSLRQIAHTTKLSVSALEALEQNHISRLPGGIFSRAFVRSYALEIGVDPEQTVREFLQHFPRKAVVGSSSPGRAEKRWRGSRLARTSIIAATVVVVGVAILFFSLK